MESVCDLGYVSDTLAYFGEHGMLYIMSHMFVTMRVHMGSVCDLGCVKTFFDTLAYFGEHVYIIKFITHDLNRSIHNTRDSFYKYSICM